MTSLKTLKDIEYSFVDAVDVNYLREEMIKWVKELEKPVGEIKFFDKIIKWDDEDKNNWNYWYGSAYKQVAKAVIMEIFNLTKEDLK